MRSQPLAAVASATLVTLPSTSCRGAPPHFFSAAPVVALVRSAQQEMESSVSPGGAPLAAKTEREVLKPAECCGQASSPAMPSWRPVSAGSTSSTG